MDKNAIKKYAVWARRELISRVSQRAALYEITADGYGDQNASSVHSRLLSAEEKKQRSALIAQIKEKGYEQVMEEIAYTWFNRFSALRFMEVNGYLPTRIRVFTNDDNAFKPQILDEAINMEMDGLDMQRVYDLKNANDDDALFKYMIITQCNALSSILPGMFQRISDYTELLFPDNLLREGSVVEQMIAMIPQEDWTDQVQIIGWLYQFYIAEPKDQRINARSQYEKEDIPFVTQLFTPDWIVRYMVENSLGRMWLEGHPNDNLKFNWKFYLDKADHEPETKEQLAEIRKKYALLKPEDIMAIDPCQGSGHILAYMFDVLVQIYEAYGYSAREAAANIVERNIWGLDIDERATQLAYFSIMMKARQYDRRFFSRGIQPHVYAIPESNNLDTHCIEFFINGRKDLQENINVVIQDYYNAKTYGSIIRNKKVDFELLLERCNEIKNENNPNIFSYQVEDTILPLVKVAYAMAQKYHIVVTNPPYLSSKYMPDVLKTFIIENYKKYKTDLFTAFMIRCSEFGCNDAQIGMLTPYLWMFLNTYENTRKYVLSHQTISSLIQLEYNAFEAACVPVCCFTMLNCMNSAKGTYIRLSDFKGVDVQEIKVKEALQDPNCDYMFSSRTDIYQNLPGTQFAYWIPDQIFQAFDRSKEQKKLFFTKSGLTTGANDVFLKVWYEIDNNHIYTSKQDKNVTPAWYFHLKGGVYRKWYGNLEYVLHYDTNSITEMKKYPGFRHDGKDFFFRTGATWGKTTTGPFSARIMDDGATFNTAGCTLFSDEYLEYVTALLNSKVGQAILNLLCPSLSYAPGDVETVPVIVDEEKKALIKKLVLENKTIAKMDWDSFETSREFAEHPLLKYNYNGRIADAVNRWMEETNNRFDIIKANEEEINRLFIEIYNVDGWITPEVDESQVSVYRSDAEKDIKSLIAYAIGCLFGRYSLDKPGLVFAGGEWQPESYISLQPDNDNIIPICNDAYFTDDLVARFEEFIKVAFGEKHLEENLTYIASFLKGKGTTREILRSYMLSYLYDDLCNIYAVNGAGKRPIYWLFDSGKKNGFKCLVYMHRYKPDLLARIRTDYVHEQQSRYRTAIEDLEKRINSVSASERMKFSKQLQALQEQAEEVRLYEEKIHHLADKMIKIDLDNGFKINYDLFKDVLAKVK